jgi:flagellar protein FlbD
LVQVLDLTNSMILLNRLNGSVYYLNADLVMTVEGTPDTVITLVNGTIFIVKNRPEEVVEKIIQYQQKKHSNVIGITGD